MNESIRCLTVKQPYAAAIVAGRKQVENRKWQTKYRGLLLIHAGAAKDMLPALDNVQRFGEGFKLDPDHLPFSAIVGAVRVMTASPWRTTAANGLATYGRSARTAGVWITLLRSQSPFHALGRSAYGGHQRGLRQPWQPRA